MSSEAGSLSLHDGLPSLNATGLEEYGMASDLRSRAGGGLAGTKRPQVEEQKVADQDTITAADSAKHDLHKQGSNDSFEPPLQRRV